MHSLETIVVRNAQAAGRALGRAVKNLSNDERERNRAVYRTQMAERPDRANDPEALEFWKALHEAVL